MDHSKKINEENYYKVLNILHTQPNITQRKISRLAGISLGSVNYCLKSLVAKGFVKLDNFKKSDNKISYMYILTPQGILKKVELTSKFLKRKMQEYQELEKEIEQLTQSMNQII